MGLYANRLQVPIKELSEDWFPEEGELFQDSSDNLYMGDNVTASNALTPINGGASYTPGIKFTFDQDQSSPGLGAGQFRINNSFAQAATKLHIHVTDANGTDRTALLSLFTSGIFTAYRLEAEPLQYKVLRMVNDGLTPTFFTFDVEPMGGARPTQGEVLYLAFDMDSPGVRKVRLVLSQADTDAPTEVDEVLWSVPGTRSYYLYDGPGVYSLTIEDGIDLTTLTPVSPMIADAEGKTCVTTVLAANKLQITTTEDGMTGFMVAIDLYS